MKETLLEDNFVQVTKTETGMFNAAVVIFPQCLILVGKGYLFLNYYTYICTTWHIYIDHKSLCLFLTGFVGVFSLCFHIHHWFKPKPLKIQMYMYLLKLVCQSKYVLFWLWKQLRIFKSIISYFIIKILLYNNCIIPICTFPFYGFIYIFSYINLIASYASYFSFFMKKDILLIKNPLKLQICVWFF